MKNFQLRTWMTENRDQVISEFVKLTNEQLYNQITQNQFMWEVWNLMKTNNPRSAKNSANLLPHIVSQVYVDNSKIGGTEITPNYSNMSESSRRQLPSSMR